MTAPSPFPKCRALTLRTPPGVYRVSLFSHKTPLLCPLYQVKYMIHGASWLPAYDVRADTLTNSMSCTYYGSVSQWTPEDWEGARFSYTLFRQPPSEELFHDHLGA